MTTQQLDKDEFARRGKAIYEEVVRPQLTDADHDRIVAIDVETRDYAIDDSVLAASRRLRARRPGTLAWFVRVGSPAVYRMGGSSFRKQS